MGSCIPFFGCTNYVRYDDPTEDSQCQKMKELERQNSAQQDEIYNLNVSIGQKMRIIDDLRKELRKAVAQLETYRDYLRGNRPSAPPSDSR